MIQLTLINTGAGSGPLRTLLSHLPAGNGYSRFKVQEALSLRANIYYQALLGKRLRSMVEVQKYLIEHPEYMVDGLSMAQFSFQIPRPLQENYVRKRPAASRLTAAAHASRTLEPTEANPIARAGPDDIELLLGSPYLEAHVFDPVGRPTKKRAKTRTPSRVSFKYQHRLELEGLMS